MTKFHSSARGGKCVRCRAPLNTEIGPLWVKWDNDPQFYGPFCTDCWPREQRRKHGRGRHRDKLGQQILPGM